VSRRRLLLGTVALASALLEGVASAEPMRRIPGTVPRALARMAAAGPAPADLPLEHITVFLGVRERAALDALIAAQQDPRSPHYRQWIDAAEFADRFAPRRDEYERVRRWFTARGFRIVRDSPHRLALVLAGSVGQVEAALATRIRLFRDRGRTRRGPAVDPSLPEDIATSVRGILGLDDLPKYRPSVQLVDGQSALAPDDFAAAYAVAPLHAAGLSGAGQSIAVVARSNFRDEDMVEFARRFMRVPPRTVVRRFAGRDPGILEPKGEELEVLLDTQWAAALAPGAQVNVVISTLEGDIPESVQKAIEERLGNVVTISFTLCEPAAPVISAEIYDSWYAVANAQGQTVLVASGDSGSTECAPSDPRSLAVNVLASSPHAVAVGGTSFALAADGTVPPVLEEAVWNDRFGASGGGESQVFARPRHQLAAGLSPLTRRRALPDLSLAASPGAPGYVIVQGGGTWIIGGTSAGAPAFASVLALVNERLAVGGLGQLVPALYRLGNEQARGLQAPVFRDVTTGTNGLDGGLGFAAATGFDLATGWGTPLSDALAAALAGPGRCEPLMDCLVPGAGSPRRRCAGEWLVEMPDLAMRRGLPQALQVCRDGDPSCDVDATRDGRCTVNVALCLNVFDPRPALLDRRGLPACEPGLVRDVRLRAPEASARTPYAAENRAALLDALGALPELPTRLRAACTATVPVIVPLEGEGGRGTRLVARVGRRVGSATARLKLRCIDS